MIYLKVANSAYGYSIGPALRKMHNEHELLMEIFRIASDCDMYPEEAVFNIFVPRSLSDKKLEQFCVMAQLQDFHIELKDFHCAKELHKF